MRNQQKPSTLRLVVRAGALLLLLSLDLGHAFGSASVLVGLRLPPQRSSSHRPERRHCYCLPQQSPPFGSRSIRTALAAELQQDHPAGKTKDPTPPNSAAPSLVEDPVLINGGDDDSEDLFLKTDTADDLQKNDAMLRNNNNNNNAPDDEDFVETMKEAALQVGSDLKDAALKMGGDLFVALRWGAANALTQSLPPNERDELLRRVQPENPFLLASSSSSSNEEETELLMKNSVIEAVAAAMAEDSQREEARWEREKEALLKQAQEAAQKRVESDLAVQKQRLEQEKREMEKKAEQAVFQLELERERALQQKDEEQERLKKELAKKMQDLKELFERKGMESTSVVTVKTGINNTTDVNPILGPVLLDLGYKRIHTVSAEKLATIPVWKKQRIYRHNRAKAMAQDKLKTLHLGLPGVICLHEEENGKLAILDGQHRVGMMSILQEKQKRQLETTGSAGPVDEWIDLDNILVEVYPQTPKVRHLDHAQDIFLEINKAEPVRVIDMPGVATKKDRSIISLAVNSLELKYANMFSPSQRCRPPNLNIDNLRDSIFAANIIKRHNLKTGKQLLDWMLQQNEALESKLENDPEAQGMFNAGAWSKASANKFYLGLESSWLYN